MSTEYLEVERKYAAGKVDPKEFRDWIAQNRSYEQFCFVTGYDDYYRQGPNVLRHRYPDEGPSELTVKVRKSELSIESRHEVDLMLDSWEDPAKVKTFLAMSGWTLELSLHKRADIWTGIRSSVLPCTIATYDIKSEGHQPRRFIEVEVEKSPYTEEADALGALLYWDTVLKKRWGDIELLSNTSLYEMYSGKSYKVEP